MASPKYRRAHQAERKRLEPHVAAGQAYCAQPVCLMRNRWIPPGTPWCLGHDDTGTRWIGPVHERCNATDGARRGNTMRAQKRATRTNRWAL